MPTADFVYNVAAPLSIPAAMVAVLLAVAFGVFRDEPTQAEDEIDAMEIDRGNITSVPRGEA